MTNPKLYVLKADEIIVHTTNKSDIKPLDVINTLRQTKNYIEVIKALVIEFSPSSYFYWCPKSKQYPDGTTSWSLSIVSETPKFTYKIQNNLYNEGITNESYAEVDVLKFYPEILEFLPIQIKLDCKKFTKFLIHDLNINYYPDNNIEDYLDNDNMLIDSKGIEVYFDEATCNWFNSIIEEMCVILKDEVYTIGLDVLYSVPKEYLPELFKMLDNSQLIVDEIEQILISTYPNIASFENFDEIVKVQLKDVMELWEEQNLKNPNKVLVNLIDNENIFDEKDIQLAIFNLSEGFNAISIVTENMYNENNESYTKLFEKNYPFYESFDELTLKVNYWADQIEFDIDKQILKHIDQNDLYANLIKEGVLRITKAFKTLENTEIYNNQELIEKYFSENNVGYLFNSEITTLIEKVEPWLAKLLTFKF